MDDLIFQKGISEKQIDQLINFSREDEVIKKNTNDPKRFKDRLSYDEWSKIPKHLYVLTNNKGGLLGLIWIRERKLDEDHTMTFGIRLYAKARGKGLSESFLRRALEEYSKNNSSPKKFWLETNPDNFTAIKLYEKFGFKKFGVNENGRIIMIQS